MGEPAADPQVGPEISEQAEFFLETLTHLRGGYREAGEVLGYSESTVRHSINHLMEQFDLHPLYRLGIWACREACW